MKGQTAPLPSFPVFSNKKGERIVLDYVARPLTSSLSQREKEFSINSWHASLRQQSLDHAFGGVITAFADMEPADAALFVEHKDRGPGFDVVGLPGFVIIVGDNRIFDSQARNFAADVIEIVLAVGFRRVYADDR